MQIGNVLINSLIFSSLLLVAAVIFGLRADKKSEGKPALRRRSQRSRRRPVEIKAEPRVRAGASGGR